MKKFVRGTLIGLAACVIGLSSIAQATQEQNTLEIYPPHAAPATI